MEIPMLRKIIGPDGTLKVSKESKEKLTKFVTKKDDQTVKHEFMTFKSNINDKISELLSEQTKGGRIHQDSDFIYSLIFNQEVKEIDVRNITPEIRTIIDKFIQANTVFRCGLLTTDGQGHSIFIKKLPGSFLIIDPHGTSFGSQDSSLSRKQYNDLKNIFDVKDFQESQCRFQGAMDTCALWSFLFFMYSNKTPEEIDQMLNNTAELFPENFKNNPNVKDYILLLIFMKFDEEGFATPEEIAAYTPLQMKGLGKCRKCGLPKA